VLGTHNRSCRISLIKILYFNRAQNKNLCYIRRLSVKNRTLGPQIITVLIFTRIGSGRGKKRRVRYMIALRTKTLRGFRRETLKDFTSEWPIIIVIIVVP